MMGRDHDHIVGVVVNHRARGVAIEKGVPHALAFHGNGLWAVVTSLGMDRVGILSGLTGRVLGRVDVPSGPRGLVVDSARDRVYVLSRHAMTVRWLT